MADTSPAVHSDCHYHHTCDDHGGRRGYGYDDHGRASDHMAYESITTPKDTINALNVIGNRQGDNFNTLERSVENTRSVVGGLVTDASFRALEQFNLLGVRAEKLSAATDVLVQKTTGEIQTQITLTAKDGIIDASKNAAALVLQAEKIASATALEAQKLASAAAAAAAECCCELKMAIAASRCDVLEAIRDRGDKTDALINGIERDRQAVALVDSKIELSNCKQNEAFRAMLAEVKGK